MNPKILGVITARVGSKRLPGKNLLPLGGKPLLTWTIEAAYRSEIFCAILLSTDDTSIADAGRKAGALVPWLRPSALASDSSTSVDVVLHALEWYEKEHGPLDGVMLLQPTSPFRTSATIRKALEEFVRLKGQSIVSVGMATKHPAWCFYLGRQRLIPVLGWEKFRQSSQELPPAFVVNGSVYLVHPTYLKERKKFVDTDSFPLIIEDPVEGLDIDTPFDMDLAREYCKLRSQEISLHQGSDNKIEG